MIAKNGKSLSCFRVFLARQTVPKKRDDQFSENPGRKRAQHCQTERAECLPGTPLSGATFVAMMQSTDLGDRHNLTGIRRLDRTFVRRVLFETQVRASLMIIIAERN